MSTPASSQIPSGSTALNFLLFGAFGMDGIDAFIPTKESDSNMERVAKMIVRIFAIRSMVIYGSACCFIFNASAALFYGASGVLGKRVVQPVNERDTVSEASLEGTEQEGQREKSNLENALNHLGCAVIDAVTFSYSIYIAALMGAAPSNFKESYAEIAQKFQVSSMLYRNVAALMKRFSLTDKSSSPKYDLPD